MRSWEDFRISGKEGVGTGMELAKGLEKLFCFEAMLAKQAQFDLSVCLVLVNDFGEGEFLEN